LAKIQTTHSVRPTTYSCLFKNGCCGALADNRAKDRTPIKKESSYFATYGVSDAIDFPFADYPFQARASVCNRPLGAAAFGLRKPFVAIQRRQPS
jgi:hypothetical protein